MQEQEKHSTRNPKVDIEVGLAMELRKVWAGGEGRVPRTKRP